MAQLSADPEKSKPLIPLSQTLTIAKIDSLNDRGRKLPYSQPDSSFLYGATALQHAQKISYGRGEAAAWVQIGKAYYIKGEYGLSLAAAQKALNQSRALDLLDIEAAASNNIGLIYLAQHNYARAIVELKRSLGLANKTGDLRLQANTNFNIGICYDETRKPDSAVRYLETAISISRKSDNKQIRAMAYNRLGETYFHAGKHQDAIAAYRQVITDRSFQDSWENSFAYSGLAQAQLALGDYTNSVENAKTGLENARAVNAKWDIERSLKILHAAYAAKGDYRNAYEYLKLNKQYGDSLYTEAKENEINALHLKQKLKENDELYNEQAYNLTQLKMSNRVAIVVAILAVLLLISKILIYYFYRQKSKLNVSLLKTSQDISSRNELIMRQKNELEQLNKTKDQLFAIIGHDLRGPFASLLQAMDVMKSGDLSPSDMKDFMDNFHEKLTVTALMLDNLVLWAENQRKGATTLPAQMVLQEQIDQTIIVFDYLAEEKNISLSHVRGEDLVVYADTDQVRIIIHNLIGNAIKFTPGGGRIEVFYTEDAERVTVHIKDSGVGMSEDKLQKLFNLSGKDISSYGTNKEKGIGIGLVLVKEFVEKNDALLQVTSKPGEGTEFRVSFKRSGD